MLETKGTIFTIPANASYAKIILAVSNGIGHGGTFLFDNIVMEEGNLSATQVTLNRNRITLTVAFGDEFLVQGTQFEDFARPETTWLPVPITSTNPAFAPNLGVAANALYKVNPR